MHNRFPVSKKGTVLNAIAAVVSQTPVPWRVGKNAKPLIIRRDDFQLGAFHAYVLVFPYIKSSLAQFHNHLKVNSGGFINVR